MADIILREAPTVLGGTLCERLRHMEIMHEENPDSAWRIFTNESGHRDSALETDYDGARRREFKPYLDNLALGYIRRNENVRRIIRDTKQGILEYKYARELAPAAINLELSEWAQGCAPILVFGAGGLGIGIYGAATTDMPDAATAVTAIALMAIGGTVAGGLFHVGYRATGWLIGKCHALLHGDDVLTDPKMNTSPAHLVRQLEYVKRHYQELFAR